MDIRGYDVVIKRHAFVRAMERGITPDMIDAAIRSGRVERFGKRNVRFGKEDKDLDVVCGDGKGGEEIVNMHQLREVADKYRVLKLYHAKLSLWGQSLGLRIPKALATEY